MASNTAIEWTDQTWNPLTGCKKVSPGCAHCYAEIMAARLASMAEKHPRTAGCKAHYLPVIDEHRHWNGHIDLVEEALRDPLRWKKPSKVFVNSMSDLFHEDVPLSFIQRVFEVMRQAHWHQFQVLTKRSERLLELDQHLVWTPNIWMGVSVETDRYLHRIDHLRQTHAAVRFLSLEPLLGPLPEMDLRGIHWVIVGGESGPGCRPMQPEWVMDIRDQCVRAKVPFFYKQWGSLDTNPDPDDPTAKQNTGDAKGGRMLDGRTWDEMPP